MAKREKIKVGIISAGFMGKVYSECYKRMPEVELVMVVSKNRRAY